MSRLKKKKIEIPDLIIFNLKIKVEFYKTNGDWFRTLTYETSFPKKARDYISVQDILNSINGMGWYPALKNMHHTIFAEDASNGIYFKRLIIIS